MHNIRYRMRSTNRRAHPPGNVVFLNGQPHYQLNGKFSKKFKKLKKFAKRATGITLLQKAGKAITGGKPPKAAADPVMVEPAIPASPVTSAPMVSPAASPMPTDQPATATAEATPIYKNPVVIGGAIGLTLVALYFMTRKR